MNIACRHHGEITARNCLLRHLDARAKNSGDTCATCQTGAAVRKQAIENPELMQPELKINAAPTIRNANTWQAAYQRICEVTGKTTQTDLAAELNVRQSSISDAKRRDSIPDSWLLVLLQRYSINPGWILTGVGSKYLLPSNSISKMDMDAHVEALREELKTELIATRTLTLEQAKAALMAHYPAGTKLHIKFHESFSVPDQPRASGVAMGAA